MKYEYPGAPAADAHGQFVQSIQKSWFSSAKNLNATDFAETTSYIPSKVLRRNNWKDPSWFVSTIDRLASILQKTIRLSTASIYIASLSMVWVEPTIQPRT